jgi:Flp pilus assembly protein TadG
MRFSTLRREKRRKGAAAVEFAVILPFILVIIIGMWDLGQLIRGLQIVSVAAREAGRQAASGTRTVSQITSFIQLALQQNGIPTADVAVTYTNLTSGLAPDQANQSDVLTLQVQVPFKDLQFVANNYGPYRIGPQMLSIITEWESLRDQPVTVPTTIPSN